METSRARHPLPAPATPILGARPQLTPANGEAAATRLWRVRIKTDDLPETLARLAIRLADLECRILAFTRTPTLDGVLDELVLRPGAGLPQHLIVDAINSEGGECLGLTEIAAPTVDADRDRSASSMPACDDPATLPTSSALPGSSEPIPRPTGSVPPANASRSTQILAADLLAGDNLAAQTATARLFTGRESATQTTAFAAPIDCESTAQTRLPGPSRPSTTTSGNQKRIETVDRALPDPATTALVAARQAIADPERCFQMLQRVLAADFVTLVPATEANPGRTEGGHRAVFPAREGQAFVARRRWVAFAEHELAEAEAFLAVLSEARQNLAGPVVVDRPDGVAVVLRLGTPRDVDAIGALHSRCSPKTLFSRYHTGLRTVPRRWLHRLLLPPRGVSLLAACGRDLVGFGQLIFQGDGTAEVSLLVEDAWQRQGIGTALLARLASLAVAEGIGELVAVCLPGSDAMVRTAARAGLQAEPYRDDSSELRLLVAAELISGSRTSLCRVPRAAPASSAQP